MLHCAPPEEVQFVKDMACVWESTADSNCRIFSKVLTVSVLGELFCWAKDW